MQAQTTTNLNYRIIRAKDCNLEVYRLLIWLDGKLVTVATHMSRAGAQNAYNVYLAKLGK